MAKKWHTTEQIISKLREAELDKGILREAARPNC